MAIIVLLKKFKRFLSGIRAGISYKLMHRRNRRQGKKYIKLPLENKIVFSNFNGLGYGCNPKYISEEILRRGYDWDLVWLVNDLNVDMPPKIRKVKFDSEDSCKELMTAKIIINNVKGELNFYKRKEQVYIETWHAGFSIKQLEREAKKMLPFDYILESKDNSKITDYLLSNSKEQTLEYKKNFWYKGEILEFGLPRNDPYFSKNTDQFSQELKKSLKIQPNDFVLIYAPTFRSGKDTFASYQMDFDRLLKAAESSVGGSCTLLIRTHPNITKTDADIFQNPKIIDVSKYPDMQELLIISDLLITDYSSTMFEFALLDKPTILFATDAEKYHNEIRGLKDIFWQSVFPLAETNEELENLIKNIDWEHVKENAIKIKSRFCTFDQGDASKKVVDFMAQIINNGKFGYTIN